MLYNNDLKDLFELLDLKEEDIFKGGEGVYKQQQAEKFMNSVYHREYERGQDDANNDIEQDLDDKYDEGFEDGREEVTETFSNELEEFITNPLKLKNDANLDDETFEKVKSSILHWLKLNF